MSRELLVQFNKKGYDPFIDFLKAYAILCVVFGHCFPTDCYQYILFQIWGDMQVPIFILIQVFHSYKKGVQPHFNFKSIFKRIILPFVVVQFGLVLLFCLFSSKGLRNILINCIVMGGIGPGSYFGYIFSLLCYYLLYGRYFRSCQESNF